MILSDLCSHHGGKPLSSFAPTFTQLLEQGLLDFSTDFDVALMDKVVMAFYTGVGQEVR